MDCSNKYIATVKFSSVKTCFLMIPDKWRKTFSGDLHIFKIQYGESNTKEAYLSCGADSIKRKDVESKVFMHKTYAEKLGITEREMIELTPVTTALPMSTKVILEPLTSDDWEIMELNATFIEKNLMNQIRVVWTNQVFPFWVSQSLIYCKVVACTPEHNPVILNALMYVSIVPKDRYLSTSSLQSDSDSLLETNKKNYLQFEHLRYTKFEQPAESTDDENPNSNKLFEPELSSIAFYAPYFLTSWFKHSQEDKTSFSEEYLENSSDFYQFNFDSVLRVLPYSNPNGSLSLAVQATTVFISASTYVACSGQNIIPPCFVAVLQKFSLPERKFKKNANNSSSKADDYSNNVLNKKVGKTSKSSELEHQKIFNSVIVTVMIMRSAEEDEFKLPANLFIYKNAIVVPKELKRGFNLEVSSLVHLKSVDTKPVPSFAIILHPVSDLDDRINLKMVQDFFLLWAFRKKKKNHSYVISDGTLVNLRINDKKYDFYIQLQEKEFSPKSSNHSGTFNSLDSDKSGDLKQENMYGFLNYKVLKKTPVKIGLKMSYTIFSDRPYLHKDSGLYQDINTSKLEELGGVKEFSVKAVEDIEYWLKLRPLSFISNHSSTYCGCILICGPKGVGKTAFVTALCKKFANPPHYVFVQIIQCLPLKGKRVETIAKKWDEIVSEAIYSQPSLLLFEDLDYIASSPSSHEQGSSPDGIYFTSISQAFIQLMNRVIESESKIAIMVTAQSLHSLHSSLVNTRGRHIFRSILEVNPPNPDQREEIIFSMLQQRPHISKNTIDEIKLSDIAAKTEGYVAQDLGTLVDRATHAAWVRLASSNKSDVILKKVDFEVSLKSFVPSSLRGISLQMQDQRTWNDVGGLKQVKKIIQQIIMWPTKYKQIYRNYSLKPQTNILLYGAPGTGKTLLAGVVANACGLNFISIKGPELLSKYIGASEQAVRDLFKRATTARPCILFFDEFDSIAPRRGHDSTGVTDRVVNQLLTQLDGVESLEGVHVLAATSRPSLIDPALLRPGRLDKCLLCPLPDKDERKEILECLSSKLPLSEEINFDMIASLTEHFSGADLQALLYTAHIQALHNAQYSSARRYSTCSEDTAYSFASDKLLYIPTLEEGVKTPSYEDGKKIIQDVSVVQDKYFVRRQQPSRKTNSLSVSITQMNLLKASSEMKPSVSAEERLRYEIIFKKFQNALSGKPTPPSNESAKRITLA